MLLLKTYFGMNRYTDDMELEDAIHTAILTLKEGYVQIPTHLLHHILF